MTKRTKRIFFAVLLAVAFVLITGIAGAAGAAIYNDYGPGWYVAFVICCTCRGFSWR